MRFISKKAPKKKTDLLVEQISTGKCDDTVISELKVAAGEIDDPADMERMFTGLMDIAMKSTNPIALAYAIKALVAFQPVTTAFEEDLELRALALAADGNLMAAKPLQDAIAGLFYLRASERTECAGPFIGPLLGIMESRTGGDAPAVYNTLMIVAANRPEFFEGQHSATLIRLLGSINKTVRIQMCKIIAVLAMSHPEYVAGAEKTLMHASSFNPDAEVKTAASEALQILSRRLQPPEEKVPQAESVRRPRPEPEKTGGLADLMRSNAGVEKKQAGDSRVDKRLLSFATIFARKADRAYKADSESQAEFEEQETEAMSKIMDDFSDIARSIKGEATPAEAAAATAATAAASSDTDTSEEAELRMMMAKVQDDFSITAGSLLDAIGMGHLAKKAMADEPRPRSAGISISERQQLAKASRPEPVRAAPAPEPPVKLEAREETVINPKEFIASIESIISKTDSPQPAAFPAPEKTAEAATPEVVEASIEVEPVIAQASPAPGSDELALDDMVEQLPFQGPEDVAMPEKSVPAERPESPEKRTTRPPIVPASVRISAMKFKSADQSKTKKPAPAKISIKPHIKPLARQPADAAKNDAPRQYPVPGTSEVKTESAGGYVICHSCNAKMPEDSQRCAICGSDLKEPKVRCRKCGEIVPRQVEKCTHCGSAMDE